MGEHTTHENGRRRMVVRIDPRLLFAMFTEGNVLRATCVQGLPPDAQFVGMSQDYTRDVFVLCFESDSFELVPYFEELPLLDIVYRRDG